MTIGMTAPDLSKGRHFDREIIVTVRALVSQFKLSSREGRLPRCVRVRSSKHLNNRIEQDHRRTKQRIRPMLGFKRFDNAA
jgi:transposase-like protein